MDCYLGVDVGQTKAHFYVENDGKEYERKIATGFQYSREKLKSDILEFIAELPFKVKAVGVAVPCCVENDAVAFTINTKLLTGFCGTDFAGLPYKVSVINDIKAATLEESQFFPKESTIAVIINGTGTSVGVIENGIPHNGCRGWSGELGWIPVVTKDGVKDNINVMCGKGVLDEAKCPISEFLVKLENNDERALEVIKVASTYFGYAIATVIGLYNPSHLIYGGTTCTFKNYMENALKVAKEYTLECNYNCCEIMPVHDVKRVVVKGARLFGKLQSEKNL